VKTIGLIKRCALPLAGIALALLLSAVAGAGMSTQEAIAEEVAAKGLCDPLSVHAAVDQAASIQLHCSTIPGARLTYVIVSGPQHGSASLTSATGQVTYTPAQGYSGPDSFSYTAERLGEAVATVSIGVGRTPARAGLAIAQLAQSHSTWREGSRPALISRKRWPLGTTFSFTLSQPAAVKLQFAQQLTGRRSNGRCVPARPTSDHRAPCTRVAVRGTLAFTGRSGPNKVAFQGLLPGARKLPLGRYTLRITATNAVRQRADAHPLRFTIVP
jgi:hypothetical protein